MTMIRKELQGNFAASEQSKETTTTKAEKFVVGDRPMIRSDNREPGSNKMINGHRRWFGKRGFWYPSRESAAILDRANAEAVAAKHGGAIEPLIRKELQGQFAAEGEGDGWERVKGGEDLSTRSRREHGTYLTKRRPYPFGIGPAVHALYYVSNGPTKRAEFLGHHPSLKSAWQAAQEHHQRNGGTQ
jgi:hypothetical protein